VPLHPLQTEWDADLRGGDPLGFPGYGGAPERESVLTGRTEHYALVESRFDVLGGSMGAVHGERVVRAYRRAADERLPMVVLTQSGGARMQEGMLSLIQMPRCAAGARSHAAAGLLGVAVYRSPTTGGVFASYGSLVDVRAAVAGATVGFAGPRVVELTLGCRLPADSHTAESAYAAGLVDALLDDHEQAAWVEAALGLRPTPMPRRFEPAATTVEPASAWDEVCLARHAGRPSGLDWAALLTESWVDLHSTDPTVRAGLATFAGDRIVVVALDRYAGDGRPTPAGLRLAQRAVALAARLGLPVLTLIDTPGAAPGPESEAGGIAGEVARTMAAFDTCPTTTVALCVGEGGSGGALALGHADRLLVLEHGVFSVIAPEGAAAILERDAAQAPAVAEHLRLTAPDLLDLGIVDDVVPETIDQARAAVGRAFDEARPGDRHRRLEAATARWVR
jgi:acetyl-CoA carboxylase carboxyl transferase subunit beta